MSSLWRLRLLAAVVIVCVQILSVGVLPRVQLATAQDAINVQALPNRYIVSLKPSTGISAASVATTYDNRTGVAVDQVYNSAIKGFAGEFTDAALTALRNDPNVEMVMPDFVLYATSQEVPESMYRIDADLNSTRVGNGSGSVSVDVAVLDTGVYKHPDLNVVGGVDCMASGGPHLDIQGHGTHVAGTIGAYDNGDGVVGVAPGARIYSVKVLGNNGEGSGSSLICGLDWVAARSGTIEVANMSLGGETGPLGNSCASEAVHQAVCNLVNRGVTMVVAAGNEYMNAANFYPAQYDEVITVSAFNDFDGKPGALTGCGYTSDFWFECDDYYASFSNYGADVDISAPGVDIVSTRSGGGTVRFSGTSMACPHVAGAAALIIAQEGRMSPASVRARLRMTAEPGPVAGDPDSSKEPLLNVAYLSKGKIAVSPGTTVKAGDAIQVRVGEFTPGTRAIFRFNGTYIGGDTIDDDGRGHRNYTIPAMQGGTYKVEVTNGQKTITKNVKVATTITLSPTSGPVDANVSVTFRGFKSGETVDIRINGRTVINDKAMSSTGSGSASFTLPAMPRATYTVTATGNKGSSTSAKFSVKQSAWVSSGAPSPNANLTVSYRGFKAGEIVTFRYNTQDGALINTPAEVASSTGSGSDTVTIPGTATTGASYVWVMGDQGTNVRVALTVSGAGLPTPEPTATAEPTEIPTDVPTEEPTEAPTEVPTEVPTQVPTEQPTEVPTDVPTEQPTETTTLAPTEEPVGDTTVEA